MTDEFNMDVKFNIGIIGLGYVGLPLAVAFGKKYPTIGYDIDDQRIRELLHGVDRTKELDETKLHSAKQLTFSGSINDLAECNCYIVTVPTPIDEATSPDLKPLYSACVDIAHVLKVGDLVVFESTVYPGCTEEFCVPIIEKHSGLRYKQDFHCGYSPERINPGDKDRKIEDIKKVTSGSCKKSATIVDSLYKSIICAGTYKAENIKTAEAAKIIENTQRDLNIALMNELAMIFSQLGLDTNEVLNAASTKWNFLPFKPGLVGGHCIGVDPYYLAYQAKRYGFDPELILAGRKINDAMAKFCANKLIKYLTKHKKLKDHLKLLILGYTFKEDCPDVRNTKVSDLISELNEYGLKSDVYDPLITERDLNLNLNCKFLKELPNNKYDVVILAVPHSIFRENKVKYFETLLKRDGILFDIKGIYENKDRILRL